MDFSAFFDYPDSETHVQWDDYAFLPQWNTHDWEKLLQHTQTQVYKQGDTVIRAGETERALYLVSYGTLEVLVPVRGQWRQIYTIWEGSVIGEQTFLDGKPRSATIVAATDSQVFFLSLTAFEVFAAKEPALVRSFLFDLGRILSIRLRQTTALIAQWTI